MCACLWVGERIHFFGSKDQIFGFSTFTSIHYLGPKITFMFNSVPVLYSGLIFLNSQFADYEVGRTSFANFGQTYWSTQTCGLSAKL